MNQIIIQSIGIIAYIILMWSYYRKEKIQILFMQIFSSLAFAIHYYLLDGLTGAVCNIISLLTIILIYIFEKKKTSNKSILISIMTPIFSLIALFTWENIYSIFPILASILLLAGFLIDDENTIRKIGIVVAIFWLIYGVICKSYPAILFETLTVITTLGAIIKNKDNHEIRK